MSDSYMALESGRRGRFPSTEGQQSCKEASYGLGDTLWLFGVEWLHSLSSVGAKYWIL